MATDHWVTSEPIIILGSHTSGNNNAQGRSFKSSWRRPTLRFEVVLMVVAVLVFSLGGTRAVVAQGSPTPSTVEDPNQGNPCSIQWFEAHGWLMWLAFGVFFPIGILVSRVGQHYFRQWFYAHIALQVLLLQLVTSPICYQTIETTSAIINHNCWTTTTCSNVWVVLPKPF